MSLRDFFSISERKRYVLDFRVYPRHKLPRKPGIYCIYSASFRLGKPFELLYTGKAKDVWKRVDRKRPQWREWEEAVNAAQGRTLLFTVALVPEDHLRRVEDAVIYRHQPRFNRNGTRSFGHPATTVITKGDNYLLDTKFTVDEG